MHFLSSLDFTKVIAKLEKKNVFMKHNNQKLWLFDDVEDLEKSKRYFWVFKLMVNELK